MESLGAVTFGFNLFKELNRENKGNIFFSPASILAAIGMLLLRTRGATATRLQKVGRMAAVAFLADSFLR